MFLLRLFSSSFCQVSLSRFRSTMSSSGAPKGKPLKGSVNPYMAEVKRHPQELRKVDGVMVQEDVRGPKKEGDVMARLEEVEHEVFRYQKMIERGVEANHKIISELRDKHQEETSRLWDDIFLLHQSTTKLQAQIYDLQNQNFEYETRFHRMSLGASARTLETKSSFVDGNPFWWKNYNNGPQSSPQSPDRE